MAEDDEGLVKVATRQVPCEGVDGFAGCPSTGTPPVLVCCNRCGQGVPVAKVMFYRKDVTTGPFVTAHARTKPHTRREVRLLRWVDEEDHEAAAVPEGPEWEFTDD